MRIKDSQRRQSLPNLWEIVLNQVLRGCCSLIVLFLVIDFVCCRPASSCTLVGIANESEIIIGKNRDREKDYIQSLMKIRPLAGYRYLGIKSRDGRVVTSGINEKQLVIVTASVSTGNKGKHVDNDLLLSHCATTDDVLAMARSGKIDGPVILLSADENQILVVESFDHGIFDFHRIKRGSVVRTNHCLFPSMEPLLSGKPTKSSLARFQRATEIVQGDPSPGMESVKKVLSDNSYGISTLSIARFHKNPREGRTLSSAVYRLNAHEPSHIEIAFGNPLVNAFIPISFDSEIPEAFENGTLFQINKKLAELYLRHVVTAEESRDISAAIANKLLQMKPSSEKVFCTAILKALNEKNISEIRKISSPGDTACQ